MGFSVVWIPLFFKISFVSQNKERHTGLEWRKWWPNVSFWFLKTKWRLSPCQTLDKDNVLILIYLSSYVFQSVSQPIAIVRRFPFSSSLQRMSVVTVGPGGASPVAFLKGAPEMVASFCLEESGEDLTLKTCPVSYITLRRASRRIWNATYLFLCSVFVLSLCSPCASAFSFFTHSPGVCEPGLQGPWICLQAL